MATLRDTGSRTFLDGMAEIGLEPALVPDLDAVIARMAARR